jgi:23S rRNA (cytosine1962-C5)-methyltransferase
MAVVTVKSGHVQPVWAGHPWVYAQAVERVDGGAAPGDEVQVLDPRGRPLGRGLYSPGSAIPVRLYTQKPDLPFDGALLRRRLERAVERRLRLGLPSDQTSGYRLVHAEGDALPGLVVDRFGDIAVVQFGTLGMKRRQSLILEAIAHAVQPRAIVDRTPPKIAEAEGFDAATGVVAGDTTAANLSFLELGSRYRIPLAVAQKTGFYLDQRPLRQRVSALSAGRDVLDAFAFVGAMSIAAARGGAGSVTLVESSARALQVAADCAALNGVSDRIRFECRDAREALGRAGRLGGYDVVICDPPKYAPSRAARDRAVKAMRRLAGQACRATRPGGLLVLSSCSAALGLHDLSLALAVGARDAGRRPLVLERIFQGPDHPVPAAFKEGLYLTTLVAEITPE